MLTRLSPIFLHSFHVIMKIIYLHDVFILWNFVDGAGFSFVELMADCHQLKFGTFSEINEFLNCWDSNKLTRLLKFAKQVPLSF